ncbi:MAG: hypothetical protein Q9219_004595 [cf. Caloplaca sp. 3 TL-2023]
MYDTLARIEKQLADIELDCLRKTYTATRPKLLERAVAIEAIPDFWPTVIDEAPIEIDQRIQPRDVPALNCLTAFDAERFEVLDASNGEVRSIKLTFTFKPNKWFHDEKLEKKFYWRTSKNDWSGLVSEPVRIQWKDRDLTDGLLDMAFDLWQKEKEFEAHGKHRDDIRATDEFKTLVEKVERMPQDAISIFGLFGFRGHYVSSLESAAATKRKLDAANGAQHNPEDLDREPLALPDTEIYPHGEEVAIALSEDLYPGATQYFSRVKSLRYWRIAKNSQPWQKNATRRSLTKT